MPTREAPEGNDQTSYFADSDPRDPMPDPIDVVVGNAPRRPEPTGEKPEKPPPPAQVRVDRRPEPEPPPPVQRQPRPPAPQPREPDQASMELMRQLNWQREQTQRAELAARDAYQRAAIAEQRSSSANVGMVDSAIGEAQRASEMAAARYHAALDAGDHRTAATAMLEAADTRHNLLRLQEQKAILEAEASQRAAQPPQRPQPQPQPRQPVAFNPEMAMQNILNALGPNYPRSADWVRNNPQWVASQRNIDMVDAAHNVAVKGMGLVPETDAYFDALENELQRLSGSADIRPPERQNGGGRQPQRPPMSAPPGYASSPSLRTGESRRGGVTVHLTPEQRDHAHNVLGMTDQEYAEEFLAADEGGRLYKMGGGSRR